MSIRRLCTRPIRFTNCSRFVVSEKFSKRFFFTQFCRQVKRQIFTAEQEHELMKYLLKITNLYYGLSIELKIFAYQYAKKIGIVYHGMIMAEHYPTGIMHLCIGIKKLSLIKPMKSTILTSPENVQIVHDKADKKRKSLEKKEQNIENGSPSKRTRRTKTVLATKTPSGSSDEENVNFCIICICNMPKKLKRNNVIAINAIGLFI